MHIKKKHDNTNTHDNGQRARPIGEQVRSWGRQSREKSILLKDPCLLGVPIVGRNQHRQRIHDPQSRRKCYGYINPALSGSHSGGSINMAKYPMLSWGPQSG